MSALPQSALVTGAGSGLGRALAKQLAGRGFTVWASDVDFAAAQETCEEASREQDLRPLRLDVTGAQAWDEALASLDSEVGELSFFAGCAGRGSWGDARDFSLAQWEGIIQVNLMGAVHAARTVYPRMAAVGRGQMLFVSSLAGLVPAPVVVPYAAAKHGVVGLAQSLRPEAAECGVQVCVTCPGPIRTGFHERIWVAEGSKLRPGAPSVDWDAERAASEILRGTDANRGLIVFPSEARKLWRWSRFWPSRLAGIHRRTVARMRAGRGADE